MSTNAELSLFEAFKQVQDPASGVASAIRFMRC